MASTTATTTGWDDACDAVVVGAGHNGLILANYLARAGLSVLVLERRLEAGGGLTTEEATRPGFLHNLHSCFHDMVELMPAVRDLDLARHHVAWVRPPVQVALPFADGSGGLVQHEDLERTCASIERVSRRDAATWREVARAFREFFEIVVLPALFSPPPPPSHQALALEGSPEGMTYLKMARQRPIDVVTDLFEDARVRALVLAQLPIPRGVLPDYAGLGMLVPLVIAGVERSHLCVGGSHGFAHALWRALLQAGGRVRGVAEVTRIVVEKGVAVGVEVAGGARVQAKRLVASAIDVKQTFLRLVGEESLPAGLAAKVRAFRHDEVSLLGVHLALAEPPRHAAAGAVADLDRGLKLVIGIESPEDLARAVAAMRAGEVPDPPVLLCSVPSLHDATQAPPGAYTALAWLPAPFRLRDGGAEAWDRVREDAGDRCVARWRTYAPNLGGAAILARRVLSPLDIPRKLASMPEGSVFHGRVSQDQIEAFRPLPELAQYRTPIERLYLCGSCTHPGGGITGAPAYNALQAMAEDLKLRKWWSS